MTTPTTPEPGDGSGAPQDAHDTPASTPPGATPTNPPGGAEKTPGSGLPPGSLDGYFWERHRRSATLPVAVGVLGLAALGIAQQVPVRHGAEHDLTARSQDALRQAGLPSVGVTFTGRDGVLTGTVTAAADRARALSAVRGLEGVRDAEDRLAGPGATPGPTTSPTATPTTTPTLTPSTTPTAPSRTTPPPSSSTAPVPTHLSVRIDAARARLIGPVPSAAVRDQLIASARAALPGVFVVDRMTIDPAASDAGLDKLPGVLRALGPDASVTVELGNGTLVLAGGVATQAARESAVAAAAAVTGDPAAVSDQLRVDPRLAVVGGLRTLPPVTFRTAYSTLTRQDRATVRRIAELMKANPGVTVRVLGFTDDVGPADINYGLSYARAETVVLTLRHFGVERSRLSFRAYGERHPKVPNTSAANRAMNRRVEFQVLP